jgi:hypothetical protein
MIKFPYRAYAYNCTFGGAVLFNVVCSVENSIIFIGPFVVKCSMTEEVFEEDNVLDWILEMHHGNTMKNVSRQSLMSMVENYDYLAVVFCRKMITLKKKVGEF